MISSVAGGTTEFAFHSFLSAFRGRIGTVVKAVPCNHPVKYLDDQWEDSLFAEEPGYVVVRREIESVSHPEDNGS